MKGFKPQNQQGQSYESNIKTCCEDEVKVPHMSVCKMMMMVDGYQSEGVIVTHAVIYITWGTFQYH